MKFAWFIAVRYLTKGRKNSFISIISLVSILGIAIGVAALIIALSLINGFQNDIRNRILSSSAHIMVSDRFADGFTDYRALSHKLEKEFKGVKAVMPVVYGTVLVKGTGREVSGAIFRGLDLGRKKKEPWLAKLEFGRLPANDRELLLGREMALKLNLFAADSCLIVSPQAALSPLGIMPRFKKFRISGIFRSGLFEFDSGTVIAGLGAAQQLFSLKNKISYLQVNLDNIFSAEKVAARMRGHLGAQYAVITWMELNQSLYSALEMEKTVLFFTLTLIIIVASLNIIAGLILLVMQKIKDIGILLSYGTSAAQIRKIFFLQGAIIGLLGTALGVILGLGFCFLANRYELIQVPAEIYQVSFVPFRINFLDLAAVIVASLLISFSATLIPSRKAAAVDVVDAVKYE
ncbi:MAG: ABC transporter permease [Acidobacteria bacterium]|nr:ABC transporter permease [Acidobacteriota bacterium]MBU4307696.1 ABC transporter permease [Acidobacteriota bacterium]MBU4405133.1 ABC transporter permease [Acidobacteriota bacterium]MCG2811205.1 ABC transporter permease [Candidatus Aminicenantes bacterium]